MLKAGSLRHRIDIQYKLVTRKPSGGEQISWLDKYVSVPAEFTFLSVREIMVAQTEKSGVTARVKIRYKGDIDATMRIQFRGRVYNIEGVLPDPDSGREYLTLPVSQGLNDG